MSVPLFLDTDYLDEERELVRFIYWKLNIKEIDLDLLCSCVEGHDTQLHYSHDLNQIKIHIFWNQLVIKGLKLNNDSYEFYSKGHFTNLFEIVHKYVPVESSMDYVVIDHHYVWVPKGTIQNQLKDTNWFNRGSIFRVNDEEFSDLLYNKEKMSFDAVPNSIEYSEAETKAYLEFLEEISDSNE